MFLRFSFLIVDSIVEEEVQPRLVVGFFLTFKNEMRMKIFK